MPGSEAIDEIEDAVVAIARHGFSGRTWQRVAFVAGAAVDRAGYQVLRAIDEVGPLRSSELAQLVDVDRSTMSRHVRDLERGALIERVGDPTDKRASIVSLSEKGRVVVASVRAARHQLLAQVLSEWAPADRATLAPLLSRLAADFGEFMRVADAPIRGGPDRPEAQYPSSVSSE